MRVNVDGVTSLCFQNKVDLTVSLDGVATVIWCVTEHIRPRLASFGKVDV